MARHICNPRAASASGGKSSAYYNALLGSFLFVVYSVVSLLADPLVTYAEQFEHVNGTKSTSPSPDIKFTNPLYNETPDYRLKRRVVLLGMTQREAMFSRRMIASLILGVMIGLERRAPNRPTGVRVMALVSMASCAFTICSAFAFEDSTQEWDASRVSAALPSGVGFLGAALIFKTTTNGKHEMIGLTTACGVWVSCAVGICCGGGMYVPGAFAATAVVFLLRFGPRLDTEEEPSEGLHQIGEEVSASTKATIANAETAAGLSDSSGFSTGEPSIDVESQGMPFGHRSVAKAGMPFGRYARWPFASPQVSKPQARAASEPFFTADGSESLR